jgi:hypothetical protein
VSPSASRIARAAAIEHRLVRDATDDEIARARRLERDLVDIDALDDEIAGPRRVHRCEPVEGLMRGEIAGARALQGDEAVPCAVDPRVARAARLDRLEPADRHVDGTLRLGIEVSVARGLHDERVVVHLRVDELEQVVVAADGHELGVVDRHVHVDLRVVLDRDERANVPLLFVRTRRFPSPRTLRGPPSSIPSTSSAPPVRRTTP